MMSAAGRPWLSSSKVTPAVTAMYSKKHHSKYKAVIFDMGGVILPSPFEMFRGKIEKFDRNHQPPIHI